MKTILFVGCFLMIFFSSAQEISFKNTLDTNLLVKNIFSKDSTLDSKFQNFAIELFMKGKELPYSFFENWNKRLVGVCLINESLEENKQSLNLYCLDYHNSVEKDFHKRIYFPGFEGISSFFVKCNTNEEFLLVHKAVETYLVKKEIPRTNLAFNFIESYEIQDEKYEKIFFDKENKDIVVGARYSFLRQNGNYIIQIELKENDNLSSDTENTVVNTEMLQNWHTISVFLIDDQSGECFEKF